MVLRNVQIKRNLVWWKGNFIIKNTRSGVKEFTTEMYIEIAFFLSLFLLLKPLPRYL